MLCGELNVAFVAGPPSPLKPFCPVPATVLIVPVFASTFRTNWFCISTNSMLPALSNRTSYGSLSCAFVAGPPSPA